MRIQRLDDSFWPVSGLENRFFPSSNNSIPSAARAMGWPVRMLSSRRPQGCQCPDKKTGNLRAVQLLLGHTKLESTVRYLGIEVDDALAISEQVEL
jgi:hypothetical protein